MSCARARLQARRHGQHVRQRGAGRPCARRERRFRATTSSSRRRCRPDSAGRERETLDGEPRALRLDHVDLWLIHWPPAGQAPSRHLGAVARGCRRTGSRGLSASVTTASRSSTSSSAQPGAAVGQPDRVGPGAVRRGDSLSRIGNGASSSRATARSRPPTSPTAVSCGLQSRAASTPGAGRDPVASRTRRRRHPEVDERGADRRERGRLRIPALTGRGRRARFARESSASGRWLGWLERR